MTNEKSQNSLTPIERRGPYLVKRDDLFSVAGVSGGKARTCWALAQGSRGLITAGSRQSPQINIVAQIARKLSIPCRAHTTTGPLLPELLLARGAGAEIIQHRAGYNNVLAARARADARRRGWTEIPFGMEHVEAVRQTARQTANIPTSTGRIVVAVGSGMSLAGILWGLLENGLSKPHILGIQIGADPKRRLRSYAPLGWEGRVKLCRPQQRYETSACQTELLGLSLDPIYEAKCIPFLREDDLFWIVGIRASAAPARPRPGPR